MIVMLVRGTLVGQLILKNPLNRGFRFSLSMFLDPYSLCTMLLQCPTPSVCAPACHIEYIYIT